MINLENINPLLDLKKIHISITGKAKRLPTKGNLVYEYNPLRNYRRYEYPPKRDPITGAIQYDPKYGDIIYDYEQGPTLGIDGKPI